MFLFRGSPNRLFIVYKLKQKNKNESNWDESRDNLAAAECVNRIFRVNNGWNGTNCIFVIEELIAKMREQETHLHRFKEGTFLFIDRRSKSTVLAQRIEVEINSELN